MARDNDHIRQLYDEYADQIYRFLYWQTGDPLLAEDITSEVFMRAWKHREMLEQGNQRAWLYRVARNLITDNYRRKKETAISEDYEPVSDINLHDDAARREEIIRVRKVVAELSPLSRSVIILRFFEQLSSQEVADIMNKTPGNVRILQYRALKELKSKLTNHDKPKQI